MATDTERLVVAVESRVTDFDRGMKAVERRMKRMERALSGELREVKRATRDTTRVMEREFSAATSRIERQFQDFRKAAAASLAGAGAAAGAFISAQTVRQISDAAGEIANLRAEADRAGVAFQDFQRLKFASEQQRVSIDALTDGLKELSLRADEFIVTGKGSAAEAFERIGFGAEELSRRLDDPADLLLEILRRVEDLDRAAQIRVFDELFGGTGGEQFVQLLRDGSEAFAESMGEAAVFTDEIADRAAETDAAFRAIASNLNVGIKSAVVSISDLLNDWITKAQDFIATLERGLADVGARIGNSPIFRRLAETLPTSGTALLGQSITLLNDNARSDAARRKLAKQEKGLERQIARLDEALAFNEGLGNTENVKAVSAEIEVLNSRLERVRERLQRINETGLIENTSSPNGSPFAGGVGSSPRYTGSGVPSVAPVPPMKPAIDSAREYIGVMKEAAETTDETDEAQKRLLERIKNLQDAFTGLTDPIADALGDILFESEKAGEALTQLALKVAEMVLQGALLQQGPLSGILGGLLKGFGGFRAAGGPVSAGEGYIVGERGPEWFQPSTSGRIFDAATTKSALSRSTAMPSAGAPQPTRQSKATLTVALDAGLRAELSGEMESTSVRVVQAGIAQYDKLVAPQTADRVGRDRRRRG